MYLNTVGGSVATIEYAIKGVHENMSKFGLSDLALALFSSEKLDNKEKTKQFF